MRIDIGGVRLFFDVDGPSLVPAGPRMVERPTLMLLHGGPGADHSRFKPAFRRAAGFAQVVYLDARGHGRSDRGRPEDWTWERWADDVVDFCEALAIQRPVLLGSSFGGWVAITTAIRHSDRLGGLVLDSAMPSPLEERLAMFERLGGPEAREVARRYMGGETSDDVHRAWSSTCLPLYSRRHNDVEDLRDERARVVWNHEVIEHFRLVLADSFDPWDQLEAITCPTLVLAGGCDPVATAATARRLAEAMTGARVTLRVFSDAGHGVFREAPDRAFRALRSFVRSLCSE